LFKKAFEQLNLREQEIIFKRQLSEDSQTLEELSQHQQLQFVTLSLYQPCYAAFIP
jgi:DNA-directed RNA polymerase sigma subunit (sigma70/sigma32)